MTALPRALIWCSNDRPDVDAALLLELPSGMATQGCLISGGWRPPAKCSL